MKTNTKKLLSILLALMMMLSVVPFYASAAAEALTQANVTQWPTLSYKNADGKMYFGQTQEEALSINDDEIVIDSSGNTVKGHFEFSSPANIPTPGTNKKATIVFVPDDTVTYSGFKKSFSPVVYNTEKVALIPLDESDTIPVATEVEPGAKLSTSILSGAKYTNSYNEKEPYALKGEWRWATPDAIVNESGYYEAGFVAPQYDTILVQVYVKVASDASPTTFAEQPSVGTMTYDENRTFADVVVEGKVVDKVTGEEVAGTFEITNAVSTNIVSVGTHNFEITFTPNDVEKYLPCSTIITVEVAKAPFKFVDENGAEIVPELTVPYGTTYKNLEYSLKSFESNSSAAVIGYGYENEKAVIPVGENEIDVTVVPNGDKNVETATVKIKVTVEPATVPMTIQSVAGSDEELARNERVLRVAKVNSSDATPKGTYDIYADGVLIADDVKDTFKWTPTQTKEYTLRVVYNSTENDPCIVEEFTYNYPVTMSRTITKGENIDAPTVALCGNEVTVIWSSAAEDFKGWTITDKDGNAVDLDVDLSSDKIVFTMPDYDITIEAKGNSASGGDGGLDIDGIFGDLGDLTEGHSDNAIVNVFNNIIAWIKNIINTIIELFRSIGDNT